MERVRIENGHSEILTPSAINFLVSLHDQFQKTRTDLLNARKCRQEDIRSGTLPNFLPETASVRNSEWKVASCPKDLLDRRVEITGPAEPKMLINALNCGAKVFMADIEDSLSPTWENVITAQVALKGAVRRNLSFSSPEGKTYKLNEQIATLIVRPRGWHLEEKHFLIDGKPMSASLFDFGLFFFHNARETLARGTGPYFYLPKMESHLEARLWNSVFNFAQDSLEIPRGSIRATVLIETILAAFEMDEILYELRDHMAGLNAGRWDYIFSIIKKFSHSSEFILPDRSLITMTTPFMKAYSDLLVQTCHKRGAHAMGGMSAFIPNRKDPIVTENALKKVREDKDREARAGFDGTWVAHPDLVPIAQAEFDRVLAGNPNQKSVLRKDVKVSAHDLISTHITGGEFTMQGLRGNVMVAIEYIERWISGVGAAALHNLMEDAATAEISRAQIWQWIKHEVKLKTGEHVNVALYEVVCAEELAKLKAANASTINKFEEAAKILDELILSKEFPDFLTTLAYAKLP